LLAADVLPIIQVVLQLGIVMHELLCTHPDGGVVVMVPRSWCHWHNWGCGE
jgi:hypothetical protein